MTEGEAATHNNFKGGMRSVKGLNAADDHKIADSIVQNPVEQDSQPSPILVRSLLKNMQRKAMEDEALERELLETTRQKAVEAGRHTTVKNKPLWREKMALTTEELRLKNKHQARMDDLKVATSLFAEEFKEVSSQDMGDGKDEFLASWAQAEKAAGDAVADFDKHMKDLHTTWAGVLASAKTLDGCESAQTMLKDQDGDGFKNLVLARKVARQRLAECKHLVASLMKQVVQRAQAGDAKALTKKVGAQALAP